MKVVINKCFGGFGLSNLALKRYVELKGLTPYFYEEDYSNKKFIKIPYDNKRVFLTYCIAKDLGNIIEYDKFWEWQKQNKEKYFCNYDIKRNDKDLIQVIEELGCEKSSGAYASLKVIEIPDNISWEIEEYDGMETIEEAHRSWC